MNYCLNETKMFADISNGLAVVINSETGIYYGMNPFASNLFENIVNGVPVESIVAGVMALGAPASFEASFSEFIGGLLAKEIIAVGNDSHSEAAIDGGFAAECKFEISWDEFSDAQELLLADPIHEVKEDTGWSPDPSSLNPDPEDVQRRKDKI